MIRSAALALPLLVSLAAPAAAADQPPLTAPPPGDAGQQPPPNEMRPRRQPTPDLLRERGVTDAGRADLRRNKAEQQEVDRLYQDLMRRSAPAQAGR